MNLKQDTHMDSQTILLKKETKLLELVKLTREREDTIQQTEQASQLPPKLSRDSNCTRLNTILQVKGVGS